MEKLTNWHYGITTTNALNIRKAPSLSAQRWNNVWPVARVALIKTIYTPDWYETIYRGQKAYVSAKYMDLLPDQVHESIPDRMMYMAQAELGRSKSIYFNGYTGAWCHRFADWLAMHAGLPPEYIPNTGNCAWGVAWFVADQNSGGFFFKSQVHKTRIIRRIAPLRQFSPLMTEEEMEYIPSPGDYVYFHWPHTDILTNVSHVAIVRHVSDMDITTFEGNVQKKVVSRVFALNDNRIVGYGKPLYHYF